MTLVRSIEELEAVAARLVASCVPRAQGATLVTLSGDLGTGKTTFAKAIARSLGVEEQVTSPTFVIERIYDLTSVKARGFERLVHIDAYRLESAHELEVIGWADTVAEPKNIIVLEWPEMVAGLIPSDATAIKITWLSETERDIEIR